MFIPVGLIVRLVGAAVDSRDEAAELQFESDQRANVFETELMKQRGRAQELWTACTGPTGCLLVLADNDWTNTEIDHVRVSGVASAAAPLGGYRETADPLGPGPHGLVAVCPGRHAIRTVIDGQPIDTDITLFPGEAVFRRLDRASRTWSGYDTSMQEQLLERAAAQQLTLLHYWEHVADPRMKAMIGKSADAKDGHSAPLEMRHRLERQRGATEEEAGVRFLVDEQSAPGVHLEKGVGDFVAWRGLRRAQQRGIVFVGHGERERARDARLEAERRHPHLLLQPTERPAILTAEPRGGGKERHEEVGRSMQVRACGRERLAERRRDQVRLHEHLRPLHRRELDEMLVITLLEAVHDDDTKRARGARELAERDQPAEDRVEALLAKLGVGLSVTARLVAIDGDRVEQGADGAASNLGVPLGQGRDAVGQRDKAHVRGVLGLETIEERAERDGARLGAGGQQRAGGSQELEPVSEHRSRELGQDRVQHVRAKIEVSADGPRARRGDLDRDLPGVDEPFVLPVDAVRVERAEHQHLERHGQREPSDRIAEGRASPWQHQAATLSAASVAV